ncbi:MAG: medium chain dehydrogenase/reductase family protein [Acidobacteria bacterium]|jgi:NADPH:quinone reductase-like Zn-dependent oxidoreductase|nr:medium chain dehydrogenase/reductase family protein [Acidobacteriota bacterium]
MRQVWIPRIGEPEVLEVREAPDPEPKAGEVRIRVEASGINFADILARMGLYPDAPKLPAVIGYEVAGVVDGVGDGVEAFRDGDRVVCMTRFGGYSDVVCAPQSAVREVPDALDFEAAASIPVNYLTAWLMLVELGGVRAGDRVLVHACAGGVGLSAVQICRHFGAEVIGTASAGKHERLREMGVSACIDYRTQDFLEEVRRLTDGRGVDIALDAVGGESFKKSYKSLADLGRLFIFGASSLAPGKKRSWISALTGLSKMGSFKPLQLMSHNKGVFGVNLGHLWHRRDELAVMLGEILDLFADGTFKPVVDRGFPFDDAAAAHRYIQDRKNFGKVILTP